MALNTGHALYANVIRALQGDKLAARMVDMTDGGNHTATQAVHSALSTKISIGVVGDQGIATDGAYWYMTDTSKIKKFDYTTGTLVLQNAAPFAGLPGSPSHLGDIFVDDGKLYAPASIWQSGSETAISQSIAVYNTSDLSLITYWDVSAQTSFSASGLCKSHLGTIYGTSYRRGAPQTEQLTIHEFNLTTGAFIGTKSLSKHSVGSQGIDYDGEHYLITSHITDSVINVYTKDLEFLTALDPTALGGSNEIEGVCAWDGKIFTHMYGGTDIQWVQKTRGLHLYLSRNTAVQFLTQAQIPDEGTIVIKMTAVSYTNWRSVFDNPETSNNWESWIYGSGEIAWRVNSSGRTGYLVPGDKGLPHLYSFSWKKNGANVDVKLGVDGVIQSSVTTPWLDKPASGLWLGNSHSSNTEPNHIYNDVIVFNKELTAPEWAALAANLDDIYSAGGTSAVGKNIDARWSTLNYAGKSTDLQWATLIAVQQSSDLQWGILNAAGKSVDLRHSIIEAVGKSSDLRWDILGALASVGKSLDARWDILTTASKDLDARWSILNTIFKDVDLRYDVLAAVGKDIDLRWDVLSSITTVGTSLALQWSILATVARSLDSRWDILGSVGKDADMRWEILSAVSKDADFQWALLQTAGKQIDVRWDQLATVGNEVQLRWRIESDISFPDITGTVTINSVTKQITLSSKTPIITIH